MNRYQDIFDRLSKAAPGFAKSSAAERVARIRKLYQAVYDLRGEIGRAGLEEVGADGRGQLVALKFEVDHTCAHLEEWMKREEMDNHFSLMGRSAFVHREAKGVVLHLSTWNAPVLISLSPVVSMMAAGNAIVLKPSEVAPLAADLVVKVIEKAGLTDQIAVLTGGPEVAQALLELPFNHVCYVGNNRIGRLVMEAAAKHFAGVTLEMGGKNPVVIDGERNLEDAAERVAAARHIIGGQACLCPDYIMIDEGSKERFTELLKEKITAFYNADGKGFDQSPDLPHIINERHTLRIKALIDDAVSKGARVVLGGTADPARKHVAPTILTDVTEGMDIFAEEIFGPVLTVHGFSSREEAVREIEKRPKPLGLYILSSDQETIDWYMDNTRAGSGAINSLVVQATVPTLGFGGVNHSGIGRLGGKAGYHEFSNPRGTVADALDVAERAKQSYPPAPPQMMDYIDGMLAPTA